MRYVLIVLLLGSPTLAHAGPLTLAWFLAQEQRTAAPMLAPADLLAHLAGSTCQCTDAV